MESPDDEDDLKLVKASAGLLFDLEAALPKLLWKAKKNDTNLQRVHTRVKRRDLNYVINLIEPFQGEPQLLDAKLKNILPSVVDAYLEYLNLEISGRPSNQLDLQSAICVILYTLCKVRGQKVIVGFLNNEPRYLEPILEKLEDILARTNDEQVEWQAPYMLLLWLSHLLLTPFDLASISDAPIKNDTDLRMSLDHNLPRIAKRLLIVGLECLPMPTKAQEGAATLLLRLVIRPDMLKMNVANSLMSQCIAEMEAQSDETPQNIYERLGPLRVISSMAIAELPHLIPSIWKVLGRHFDEPTCPLSSNAVAKKIYIKTLRNIAILVLRISDEVKSNTGLDRFLETTSVLEDVIDYLLTSLSDRDTPVRYAAAKGLSRIILELEPEMGHEVIQAILDTFKEDLPRGSQPLDFRTVNALKWHGLTLALAHTLFKRSASPDQLPDIVTSLMSALQFEQRTATGSSVGTNVRDAANFGIWSLSRRYTTKELLSVDVGEVKNLLPVKEAGSVIQVVAINLILSSCLDPVGNIRRGSSAALQELIGRHPNQVHEGITLVQIVDYQAVGLRRRAMVDVAYRAAELESTYWQSLVDGLLGWRGLVSADVPSREATATALARFSTSSFDKTYRVLGKVTEALHRTAQSEVEDLHGLVLSLAKLVDERLKTAQAGDMVNGKHKSEENIDLWNSVIDLKLLMKNFIARLVRSELPSAMAQLLTALCRRHLASDAGSKLSPDQRNDIDTLADSVLNRREESIWDHIPPLARSLLAFKRKDGVPLGCISADTLAPGVAVEGTKSTLHGPCRALALGTLAPLYEDGLVGGKVLNAIETLASLTEAMNVDWRIVGLKALALAVEGVTDDGEVEHAITETIVNAVHRGLNDYTIDERGDIGSLVRLQAIRCACIVFNSTAFTKSQEALQVLHGDIYRLSLEKLDRVRLEAAKCRNHFLEDSVPSADIATVSSTNYFVQNLQPITIDNQPWKYRAILEGIISSAGISAEPLLQASRSALTSLFATTSLKHLEYLMTTFANLIFKAQVLENANTHPSLEFLAFLLSANIPQRLPANDFKWRALLSTVQKAHHKSNDISRILAAVQVYLGLAEVEAVRKEVLKKLFSMLRTNPYPRVRGSVAEVLYVITKDQDMKSRDWMKAPSQHKDLVEQMHKRWLKT